MSQQFSGILTPDSRVAHTVDELDDNDVEIIAAALRVQLTLGVPLPFSAYRRIFERVGDLIEDLRAGPKPHSWESIVKTLNDRGCKLAADQYGEVRPLSVAGLRQAWEATQPKPEAPEPVVLASQSAPAARRTRRPDPKQAPPKV